jgi:hypothetical protein
MANKRDPAHVTEFFNAICKERGGIDRLSITETAIAKALAQGLATEPIDPALIASLTAQLPPVCKGKVDTITVKFIDNGSVEVAALTERLSKSERERCALLAEVEQLKRGASGQGGGEITPAAVSAPPGEASQAGSNVVPMKQSSPKPEHADAYATLAALNAGFRVSPYIPVDPGDKRDYGPRR